MNFSTRAFQLVQGVYGLFLGAWVGAMVMLAVTAAITFRTVREFKPFITVKPYTDPSLLTQAPTILAGGIVGNVLGGLAVICGVCLVAVLVCLVLQVTVFRDRLASRGNTWANAARIVLLTLPMAIHGWNVLHLTPTIHRERAAMYDTSQNEDYRDEARFRFDRLHKLSERVVGGSVVMLALAALVSPFAFVPPAPLPRTPENAGPTGA